MIAVAHPAAGEVTLWGRAQRFLRPPSPMVAAHTIPALAAVAATFSWFRPGRFVAAGDIAPYVRDGLGAELGSVWNHQLTGAGSTSYDVVRGADFLLIRMVGLLGGTEVNAQHALLAICLATAALGSAYFARSFVEDPLAVASAGLLGVFNPFLLVLLPNPLFPLAIGMGGFLAGLVLRACRDHAVSPVVFALATIPVAYLAVNPPLVAVLVVWTLLVAATARFTEGPGSTKRAFSALGRSAPMVLALSLWWTVPAAYTLLGGGSGVSVSAQTNIDAWSFSHADNSLVNVLTLKAHWGWAFPEIFPFGSYLNQGVWPFLRWILPLGAMAGIFLARRRAAAASLAAMAVVAIVVAKGLHGPLPGLNRWFYEHVPGFWLLREPMSKAGIVLTLVYVALFAMAVERVLAWARNHRGRTLVASRAAIGCLVLGATLAPIPLWNGDVIADDRGPLPPSHVQLPDEWREAAASINDSSRNGKAFVIPQNTFYQVTTSWGFHGADTTIGQLVKRPVIQRFPGGYFAASSGFEAAVDNAQLALERGDTAAAARSLQTLAVSHVIVRRDLVTDGTKAKIDTAEIGRAVAALPGARLIHNSSMAAVYEIDGGEPVQVYSQLVGLASIDTASVNLATRLDAPMTSTNSPDVPVDGVIWELGNDASVARFDLAGAGNFDLSQSTDVPYVFTSTVTLRPDSILFSQQESLAVRVNGKQLREPRPVVLGIDPDAVYALEDVTGLHDLDDIEEIGTTGEFPEVNAWGSVGPNLLGRFSSVEDCFSFDDRTPDETGLAAILSEESLQLVASAHTACVWAPVVGTRSAQRYRVTLDYRTQAGLPARLCVWQVGPNTCAELPPLDHSSRWATFDTAFIPEPGTTEVKLFLYADGADTDLISITEYRNPIVRSLGLIATAVIGRAVYEVGEIDAGPLVLAASTVAAESLLGSFSPVEDCFRFDERSPAEAGLAFSRNGGVLQLTAEAHTACVWASVVDSRPAQRYRLTIDYRTRAGLPARLCAWQVGPNTCAQLPPLRDSRQWVTFDAGFTPEPGTTEVRLFLYADGADTDRTTTTEYRNPHVQSERSVVLKMTDRGAELPGLEWSSSSPTRYTVDVRDVTRPFTLVLAETYAPGWQLEGLPDGWTAAHIKVDGYANAWRIEGGGKANLTIRFGPQRTVRIATMASATTLLLALGLAFVAARREPVLVESRPPSIGSRTLTALRRSIARRMDLLRRRRDLRRALGRRRFEVFGLRGSPQTPDDVSPGAPKLPTHLLRRRAQR